MLRVLPGEWIALAASFLWIGFVAAISFMEAWIKFQAPGVTKTIGLSIGKKVFSALNRMEWVWTIVLIIGVILLPDRLSFPTAVLFAIAILMLLLQTIFWLPVLKKQADLLIEGKSYTGKSVHLNYIVADVVKLIALLVATILLGLQTFG
ncbi:MAG: hypothetical protein K6T34_02455 [Thermoflavifilum sp.]|nr:hypothetical protein [Thermoflavifilum sp.]